MSRKFNIVFDIKNYQNMVVDCKDEEQYKRLLNTLINKTIDEIYTASCLKVLSFREYERLLKLLEEEEKEYISKNG